MPISLRNILLLVAFAGTIPANAQSIRSRIRQTPSTAVDEKQAADLTLTLTSAAVRPVQTWVRAAGKIDKSGKVLTAYLRQPDAGLIKAGQRVRAFPPASKSSMYQAWVTRVVPQAGGAMVEATLTSNGREGSTQYVMEIVVTLGEFLSVPNEAIIEEGDNKRVVYFQHHPGMYVPQEIHTGVQGELYTQVLHGLDEGQQVVTFGSFFIDSEHKLKAGGQAASGNEHQHNH